MAHIKSASVIDLEGNHHLHLEPLAAKIIAEDIKSSIE
jgi:hypothetical protein